MGRRRQGVHRRDERRDRRNVHGLAEPHVVEHRADDALGRVDGRLRAIERAREAGYQVLHALALVDRLDGGREAVTEQAPMTALFTKKDFLP